MQFELTRGSNGPTPLVMPFELTPKAFANLSPWLERSDNPGIANPNCAINPERVPLAANPFRVVMWI